ncbi:MAG: DUF1700 domain-containing protein [Clostridia bacterium]|nr:DUF1700 domain-containing protein [Clostridia bacterium]
MLKQEFLNALRENLSGLPQADIEERLTFYGEMIDDRMEEGLSEEQAVEAIGPVDEVVSQILEETPLSKIVKEKIRPKRRMRAWEIVLLILGFPLWFPLSVAAFVLILVFYIVLWVLVICLWAIEIAFWACALACLVGAVGLFVTKQPIPALGAIGAAMILAGLSIFLFFACKAATVGTAKLAKKIVHGIKRLFVGKEKTK